MMQMSPAAQAFEQAKAERLRRRPVITEHQAMNVRHHDGWGHGLKPGSTADLNCAACQQEDEGTPGE